MADLAPVYDALRNAHAAGDTAAAQKLAAYIESQSSQPVSDTAKPSSPSIFQSVQASAPGRVVQGMRDPIDEAAAMLPKGLESLFSLGGNVENPVSRFFGSEAKRVQDINRQNETEYQDSRRATGAEGMDISRMAGNIASPVNVALAAKIPMALRGAQAIKSGVAAGAVGGALSPSGDVSKDGYWTDKAIDTAKGAGLGGLTSGALAGVARMVRPETNANAKALLDAGVTPTAGQILGGIAQKVEDKAQSIPIFGDMIAHGRKGSIEEFNRAALARALKPIGESTEDIGRAGVDQVKRKLGQAYDDLLPNLKFVPDQQFTQEMGALQQMANGLGATERRKFQSIMSDVFGKASPNGGMQGETLKIVESKLSNEAKKFSGSTDAYQKELGDALSESLRIFRDTLPRTNPGYAERLKKINEGYANYARIRQAASSTAAGANDGLFTPAQLAMAVKALDKSAGKGASATGNALMQDLAEAGTNVLSSKVADSGTAGRIGLGLGAGGAAAGMTSLPTTAAMAAALATAGLPFVGAGRKLTAAALTQRPDSAAQLAELIRKQGPLLAGGLPLALNNGNQP